MFHYFYTDNQDFASMKKNYINTHLATLIVFFVFNLSYSQNNNGQLTVIENNDHDYNMIGCTLTISNYQNRVYIPPREWVQERFQNRVNPCSSIEVTYNGFPVNGPEQQAFQFAVDIWESLLDSPVTIRVNANWTDLGLSLGSAGPAFFTEIPGGGANTLYPAALAESILGTELNGSNSIDINCNLNSQYSNWYFGTDGNPTVTQYDFVTVVLHELGHGLGMIGFGGRTGTGPDFEGYIRRALDLTYQPGAQYFSIWDTFISGQDILTNPISILNEVNFPDPSDIMLIAITSENLTCNAPTAVAQNGGVRPNTYAPSTYQSSSSYSHWAESGFTSNLLMTPTTGLGEAVHDPSNVTLGFLKDMGWTLCQGALSSNDFSLDNIKINPNPFTETITLDLPSNLTNQEFNISIIDINGRVVYNQSANAASGKIKISNLSNLKNALYFFTIESKTSDLSITQKIIKK